MNSSPLLMLCTLHFKNLGLIILSIDADPDVIRIGKLHFANSDPKKA